MSLRLKAAIRGDLDEIVKAEQKAAGSAVTTAMARAAEGAKGDWRAQISGAGMGTRLGNAIRSKIYPNQGMNAAGFVYAQPKQAPVIMNAFNEGVEIRPKNGGRYLAIPTENVPRKGRGKRMTPVEVEASFNQDLKFAKAGNGRLVAYIEAVGSKNKRGFRKATEKRLAQGRGVTSVVMFVLVPMVRLRKLLDIGVIERKWEAALPNIIVEEWDRAAASLPK